MNQILVTEKIYVTPELRRKRKLYKIQFFLCVFLICTLFSYYIYAEYDRDKSEEVSQEILLGLSKQQANIVDTTVKEVDDIIVVALNDNEEPTTYEIFDEQASNLEYTTKDGTKYTIESTIRIPRLDITYPVITETSPELLKISINKYWGPKPNEIGNYCVVGHNYKNKSMFGRLSEIVNDDIIELEGAVDKQVVKYVVYDKYVVQPENTACTSQLTNGRRELTLITCTNYGTQRLIVKAREVKE